jgi:hypothetical protein
LLLRTGIEAIWAIRAEFPNARIIVLTTYAGDAQATAVLLEPACGASLALLYERSAALESFGTLLVIVCGGATATTDQLQAWSTRFAQGRHS